MTSPVHIKARITPWDDPVFVKAFEYARDLVNEAQGHPDGTAAGAQVQHLLRVAGYPEARVEVIQSVDEKLAHTSHWLVTRNG